jgi:hypothetical protein
MAYKRQELKRGTDARENCLETLRLCPGMVILGRSNAWQGFTQVNADGCAGEGDDAPSNLELTEEEHKAIAELEATLPPALHAAVLEFVFVEALSDQAFFTMLQQLAADIAAQHTSADSPRAMAFALARQPHQGDAADAAQLSAAQEGSTDSLSMLAATAALLAAMQGVAAAQGSAPLLAVMQGSAPAGAPHKPPVLADALLALAHTLQAHARAAPLLRELYCDAAALLWHAARPLLDGVACARDSEAAAVQSLLAALHTALEAVQYEDPILRRVLLDWPCRMRLSPACLLQSMLLCSDACVRPPVATRARPLPLQAGGTRSSVMQAGGSTEARAVAGGRAQAGCCA